MCVVHTRSDLFKGMYIYVCVCVGVCLNLNSILSTFLMVLQEALPK